MITPAERFRNPPITEAVLEFLTGDPKDPDLGPLASFQEKVRDRYPKKEVLKTFRSNLSLTEGAPNTSTEVTQIGYKLSSADGKQVMQARVNGFSFSRLKPYNNWNDFIKEAFGLWNEYAGVTKARRVVRIGLRYINRIEIPLPLEDFGQYILTRPEIAPGIHQSLSTFFMRLEIPTGTNGTTAIITQTIEPIGPDATALPVILDIDAVRELDLSALDPALEGIASDLRELKNQIFFSSLTDRTKNLFR